MIDIITAADYPATLSRSIAAASASIVASLYMARPAHPADPAPYRQLWDALTAAPKRLTEHKIILNRCTPATNHGLYNAAAAADLSASGWHIRHPPANVIAHEKMWIFDSRFVLLGSSNLADAQKTKTTNVNLLIDNPNLALRLLSAWRSNWTNSGPTRPAPITLGAS